jgi:hypothetical protein
MNHPDHLPVIDDPVDSTLRLIGSVSPRPGLEKRIAARLAHAPVSKSARFFGLPRLAFASTAGLVACAAIIAGSVNHSRRILPVAPGMQLPGSTSGIGTVSGARVAPKPVAAPSTGRARSVRKPGAESGPELNPPRGVAVPKRPVPQEDQATEPR